MARLRVTTPAGTSRWIELDAATRIGRDAACDVVIDDKGASREHACLVREQGVYYLEDKGSHNGTLMRGARINRAALRHGDEFSIGLHTFYFEDGGVAKKTDGNEAPAKKLPSPARPIARQSNTAGMAQLMLWMGVGLTVLNVLLLGYNLTSRPAQPAPPAVPATQPQPDQPAAMPGQQQLDALAKQLRGEGRESMAKLVEAQESVFLKISNTDPEIFNRLKRDIAALRKERDTELDIWKRLFFIMHEEMSGRVVAAATALQRLREDYQSAADAKFIEETYESLKAAYKIGAQFEFNSTMAHVNAAVEGEKYLDAVATLRQFATAYPAYVEEWKLQDKVAKLQDKLGKSLAGLLERVEKLAGEKNYGGALKLFQTESRLYSAETPGMAAAAARIEAIRRFAQIADMENTAAEFEHQHGYALAADMYRQLIGLATDAAKRAGYETAAAKLAEDAAWMASLQRAIAARKLDKREVELDDGATVTVVNADQRGLYFRPADTPAKTEPTRRGWGQLSDAEVARLLLLPHRLTIEDMARAAKWCAAHAQQEIGLEFATRLYRQDKGKDAAQDAVAVLLNIPVKDGPFVVYEKEWMTATERQRRQSDVAEQRRIDAERRALIRVVEQAKAAYQYANALLQKNEFVKAVKSFADVAARFGQTDWGLRAAAFTTPNAYLKLNELSVSGPSDNRIDVVIMCDGFLVGEQPHFNSMVNQTRNYLLHFNGISEYMNYWNFYWMNIASESRHIATLQKPSSTALESTLASEGGLPVASVKKVHEYLEKSPVNDRLAIIFCSEGGGGTGGGGIGIFGGDPGGILVHEFFGHAFTGLDDEYTMNLGQQPLTMNAINVSITPNPEKVPWKHWLDAKTKGIGVFIGGNGFTKNHWRPTADQCNLSTGGDNFCAVCREALVLKVYAYVNPIDQATPNAAPLDFTLGDEDEIFLVPMKPVTHDLKVEFFCERSQAGEESIAHETMQYPPLPCQWEGGVMDISGGAKPRLWQHNGMTLPAIYGHKLEPVATPTADGKNIRYAIPLQAMKFMKGTYVISARVVDETPWVIKDTAHLLEERQLWNVRARTPEEAAASAAEEEKQNAANGGGEAEKK